MIFRQHVLYLRGVISFPRFSNGVFSKIQWGWGLIEWGFSKMDGVPVRLVKSQWG